MKNVLMNPKQSKIIYLEAMTKRRERKGNLTKLYLLASYTDESDGKVRDGQVYTPAGKKK